MSVTPIEPYVIRIIGAIDHFKDPTTLATHLETIYNMCMVDKLIQVLLESELMEKLYKLHRDCVVKQHSS